MGKCPLCGGDVIRNGQGWICNNALLPSHKCSFFIPHKLSNRTLSNKEVGALLAGHTLLLDGFANHEMKLFSAIAGISQGHIYLHSEVAICPACGGLVLVGVHAYNCSNYKNAERPCTFSIWRNICGHSVTPEEVKEICERGFTSAEIDFIAKDGTTYKRRLGIAPDKKSIIKM